MNIWQTIRPLLSDGVRLFRISLLEARSRYSGTYLGIFWLPISTLIFTGTLALVFRHADTMSISKFFLYVLTGYALWLFVLDSIVTGTNAIQDKFDFAVHNNLDLTGLFRKMLVDRLFEYGINLLLVAAAILLLAADGIGPHLLLFIPFLAIIIPTSIATNYLVNIATIFVPDLGSLVRTGARFLFFASPVFWVGEESSGVRELILLYNPVSYYLNLTRQTFGIIPIAWDVWIAALGISSVVCLIGYVTFLRTHSFVRNVK